MAGRCSLPGWRPRAVDGCGGGVLLRPEKSTSTSMREARRRAEKISRPPRSNPDAVQKCRSDELILE
jgi:hypothetical protein